MKLTFSLRHYNKYADWKRPFCLNTRLRVNKNFKIHIIFIEIKVNVCILCDHHVMTSIIFHTRRTNCQ